jgi:succinate dehydrogenase / fumarate reductase membrane anchor subunit
VSAPYRKAPVGAHYGLRDWIIQRVTAIFLLFYTVVMVPCAWMAAKGGYPAWKALFAGGLVRVATMLFALALLYHAWIGMRDLWMDYVQPTGVRLLLQSVTLLMLIGYAVWAAAILWG